MNRTDLELVLAIRDQGSLSAAALSLDLAAPAVTKRLAALEAQLGHRLFQRSTRRVHATPEGEAVCAHAVLLLQGFRALEAELQERQSEPSGLIRLAATLGFGRLWLGPALADFQTRHPRVQFQLQLTEQLPDLSAEGFDGAVWLWAARGTGTSEWVSRRLARNQRVLAASPAYLAAHGTPADLPDLARHQCIVVRENASLAGPRLGLWPLQHDKDKTSTHVRVQGPLSANSGELARDWALAGHGIVLRSLWDIAPHLERGELVRVLPGWSMADADIHWLAPWQPRTPRRIRLLLDFLAERFRGEPWQPAPSVALKPAKGGPAARRGSRQTQ